MRVVSFFNLKGGVGKTTITTNIAYALAESWEARVLFIDNDKQGNSSSWFEAKNNKTLANIFLDGVSAENVIQKTRYSNIDIISADMGLIDANLAVLQNEAVRQDDILKKALNEVKDLYDVCIIDNPPDINMSVFNAFMVTDDVIIVTDTSTYSVDGIYITAAEIKRAKEYNPHLAIRGILINKFQGTTTGFDCVSELKESFPVFRTLIHMARTTTDALNSAAENKKSIFETSPNSLFARNLVKFIEELIPE